MNAQRVARADLVGQLPAARDVDDAALAGAVASGARLLILDDDPTGTQTVRDVPVVTRWTVDDLEWALGTGAPGVFVSTNSRSLPGPQAATVQRAVLRAAREAAARAGVDYVVCSRGDSTLRGHFDVETAAIADELAAGEGWPTDAVVLVPAYVDAGRITVDGTHYAAEGDDLVPVGQTPYARDATFGYRSSDLPSWVEEVTAGRVRHDDVVTLTVAALRRDGAAAVGDALARVPHGGVLAVDAVDDGDLRVAALGLLQAEARGARLVYRVGPSFVRARLAQRPHPALSDDELRAVVARGAAPGRAAHGLIVVGSHVPMTTRQLARLRATRPVHDVELDVAALLAAPSPEAAVAPLVSRAAAALADGPVVLSTSRTLVEGGDGEASLEIARRVSAAVVAAVRGVVAAEQPAYVVAKGGITSSDVASKALGVVRATVEGTLLPGIVSVWRALDGAAVGLPYVVFAGNVGDEDGLATVVGRLERAAGD